LPISQFAGLVRTEAGPRAQALTLFGPILSGEFDARRHVVSSVLVLDRVDLALLRRLAVYGPKLARNGVAAPLVMTPEYIQASLDTFPLELIEIQQEHVALFGQDYFGGLSFEDAHVRLQCERELKVMLIGLRQGVLASAGETGLLRDLQRDSAQGLLRTLRGMLWLKGRRQLTSGIQVLDEVQKLVGSELSGLRAAFDEKMGHGPAEVDQLYRDVEALGELVNAW